MITGDLKELIEKNFKAITEVKNLLNATVVTTNSNFKVPDNGWKNPDPPIVSFDKKFDENNDWRSMEQYKFPPPLPLELLQKAKY